MIIKDTTETDNQLRICPSSSEVGNGIAFTLFDEFGNEIGDVFTNDKESIITLRNRLDELLLSPTTFTED